MPAIFERCVSDVKAGLAHDAAKKRKIPVSKLSEEVRSKIEDSAYGICTAELKKAGKM